MVRLKLAGALVCLAALYGGWMWLRDTSLFAVQSVRVVGLHGQMATVIRNSLVSAAREMTTTDMQVAKLRAAVAPFTAVKDLRVQTSFPHGVQIDVIEQHPVAAIQIGGRRAAVAADGTVVQGLGALSRLPTVASAQAVPARHLSDPQQVAAIELLDLAPPSFRPRIDHVGPGPAGLTVYVRNGPALYFGDATRLHAKWAAVQAVLADPGSRGATYIDVRIPERPAAQVGDPSTATGGTAAATGATGAAGTLAGAAVSTPSGPSSSTGG